MSVTNSKTVYRAGYAPLMSGVHVAPYAYCYRCIFFPLSSATQNDSPLAYGVIPYAKLTVRPACGNHPIQVPD
jgi:4-aminobutyrate aminotransferase-like enzyme